MTSDSYSCTYPCRSIQGQTKCWVCLYEATFFPTTQESVSGSDNVISGVTVLFSFLISRHYWCACLVLAGQCDRISWVGISRQTLPVQPGSLAWPLSLCLSLSASPHVQPRLLGFHVTDTSLACLSSNGESAGHGPEQEGQRGLRGVRTNS